MGNLYAITWISVCWKWLGWVESSLLARHCPVSHGMCVTMKYKTRAAAHLAAFDPRRANAQENKIPLLRVGLAYRPLSFESTVRTKISSGVTRHMHKFQIPLKEAALLWPANHGCGVHVGRAVYTPYTPLLHFWWKRKCCLFLFQKRVNCLADFQENILLCSFCINLA